jgi:hypothetical protein
MKPLFASLLLLAGCSSTYVGSLGEYQKVCDKHPAFLCTIEIHETANEVAPQIFPYRKVFGIHWDSLGLFEHLTPDQFDRVLTALEVK